MKAYRLVKASGLLASACVSVSSAMAVDAVKTNSDNLDSNFKVFIINSLTGWVIINLSNFNDCKFYILLVIMNYYKYNRLLFY